MKINLMTLIVFVIALLVFAGLLGNKALSLISMALCAGIAYLVVKIVRMHRIMNRSDDQDDAEGR